MRIDHPTVVAENFDGEQVIVHLGTGMYYALDSLGTLLWAALESHTPRDGLVAHLVDGGSFTATEAARTVDAFLEDLVAESLVVADAPPASPDAPPTTRAGLTRFSDLADVLLVDPIHDLDLDGDGWPVDAGSGLGRPPGSDAPR